MTNLKVAHATSAIPDLQSMPNIIDALKRLERIGSENSETTKKIIEAGRELSDKIVDLYPDADDNMTVRVPPDTGRGRSSMNYTIFFDKGKRGLHNVRNGEFVYGNRSAALAFAADLATGLLDFIEEDLKQRLAKNRAALSSLEQAAATLKEEKLQLED